MAITSVNSKKIQKVLFADDDANIRLIMKMSLEGQTDWNVICAGSGEEALKLIELEQPDLILLDVMMPDMDGPEILKQIRRQFGTRLPVIFVTAKVQPQEITHYKSMGASGVIMKPFHPMKLVEQIRSRLSCDSVECGGTETNRSDE